MKKLLSLVMTLMLALSAFTCASAAVSEDALDMESNTAYLLIGENEYFLELTDASYETEDGAIAAMYVDSTGEHALVVVMSEDIDLDVYDDVNESVDVFACLFVEEGVNYHSGVCSSSAAGEGYGVDLLMTVVDENGRYQGIFAGRTYCEENGAYNDVAGVFDFCISDGGNTASTAVHEDKCSICDGSGLCGHCDYGMCTYCDFGQKECYCLFGDCSVCDGMGYFSYYDYEYGIEYRDCSSCYGTGMHDYCNGTGFLDCAVCGGTGYCTICYGLGDCSYCYGTGHN